MKATKTALRIGVQEHRTNTVARGGGTQGPTGQLLQIIGAVLAGPAADAGNEGRRHQGAGRHRLSTCGARTGAEGQAAIEHQEVQARGHSWCGSALQLDSLATDILRQAEQSLFVSPTMTTVKKMVTMPQKGGAKEERNVDIVDAAAEQAAETERQNQMRSFLAGAIDVFWRLCFDMTGEPPVKVLDAKFARMKEGIPGHRLRLGGEEGQASQGRTRGGEGGQGQEGQEGPAGGGPRVGIS